MNLNELMLFEDRIVKFVRSIKIRVGSAYKSAGWGLDLQKKSAYIIILVVFTFEIELHTYEQIFFFK